jgi:DNA-binding XRE family transcriptional regulator
MDMRHNYKEKNEFDDTMTFGEVVKKVRRVMGMNQTDFADWIGVHIVTLSTYETGRGTPSLEHCIEMLNRMGFEIRIVRVNKEAIHEYKECDEQGF